MILELKDNEIFVFGSNLAGRHGKGAALQAMKDFGAIYGQGEGLQGSSYGIPTKDDRVITLPLYDIKFYVGRFIKFALQNPQYTFLVTKIGCGLAGYKEEQIKPMFKEAQNVKNIKLPESWKYVDI